MALLKEDGSLDIEWLNSLPIDEFTKVYGRLTREQVEEYWAKTPTTDGPTQPVIVDYPMESDGVDAFEFLKKQREKYGLKQPGDNDCDGNLNHTKQKIFADMTTITEQDREKYKRIDSLSEDDDNNKMNVHVFFTLLREELEEMA